MNYVRTYVRTKQRRYFRCCGFLFVSFINATPVSVFPIHSENAHHIYQLEKPVINPKYLSQFRPRLKLTFFMALFNEETTSFFAQLYYVRYVCFVITREKGRRRNQLVYTCRTNLIHQHSTSKWKTDILIG